MWLMRWEEKPDRGGILETAGQMHFKEGERLLHLLLDLSAWRSLCRYRSVFQSGFRGEKRQNIEQLFSLP